MVRNSWVASVQPSEWTPSREGDEDLSRCLDSLSRWWGDLKKQVRGCLLPESTCGLTVLTQCASESRKASQKPCKSRCDSFLIDSDRLQATRQV